MREHPPVAERVEDRKPAPLPALSAVTLAGIIALTAVAGILRFHGIGWPPHHPDEATMTRWVDYMLRHSFHPDTAYPPLFLEAGALFQAAFASAGKILPSLQPPSAIVQLRLLNAALSTLCVLLLAGFIPLFGRSAVLLGMALLAFLPIAIDHAHYAESDTLLTCVSLTAALAAAFYIRSPGRLRATLLGALCGATVAAKYNAGPVIVLGGAFLLAPVTAFRERAIHAFLWSASLLLVFLLLTPYLWLDPEWFRESFRVFVLGQYETDWTWGQRETWTSWWEPLRWKGAILFREAGRGMPPLLPAVALFGLAAAVKRSPLETAAASAFPLAFFASTLLMAPYVRSSEVVVLAPWIALWAGAGLESLRRITARRFPAAAAAVLLTLTVLGTTVLGGVRLSLAFGLPDTLTLAGEWAEQNLPSGSPFLQERYCPKMRRPDIPVMRHPFLDMMAVDVGNIPPDTLLCTASLASDRFRDPADGQWRGARGEFYRSLEESLTPLAAFHFAERVGYFLNPRVTLMAAEEPPAPPWISPPIPVTGGRRALWPDASSRGKGPALILPAGEEGEILVFSHTPLVKLFATASPEGDRGRLTIHGPGVRRDIEMELDGEGRTVEVGLRPHPLFREPFYRLRFSAGSGSSVGVRLHRSFEEGLLRRALAAAEREDPESGRILKEIQDLRREGEEDLPVGNPLFEGIWGRVLFPQHFSRSDGLLERIILLPAGIYRVTALVEEENCPATIVLTIGESGEPVKEVALEPLPGGDPCRLEGKALWTGGELVKVSLSGIGGEGRLRRIALSPDPEAALHYLGTLASAAEEGGE